VIVLYIDHIPVGCGAIKAFNANSMEVKRMYIKPGYRNQGLAKRIVQALESWMSELGYSISTLETGKNNPEAISLYLKLGYTVIPNYGQYIGIENSVCMHKILNGQ
jgi:GNAT superfamily N-acetyltransferase